LRIVRVLPFFPGLLLMLGPSGSSHADDPRDVAHGHYARGLELVGQKDYQGALREFIVAYDVSPHFAVLYNIGECHVLLGQVSEAIDALSRYLGDGRYLVPAERRRLVGDQVAELASHLNSPPPRTDRSLEKAAQDAADAAERAGEAAAQAARLAHKAAVAARVAAAAAARTKEPLPKEPAPRSVATQRTKH
jgi:tetratricopeptide (TPR) repeat protein